MIRENTVCYRHVYVPASKSPDRETPSEVIVTREKNGYCVLLHSYEDGWQVREFFLNVAGVSHARDGAINMAVMLANSLRARNAAPADRFYREPGE